MLYEVITLGPTMPVLGIMDCPAETASVGLSDSFGLLLYTDGFYEWRCPDGEMYGLDRFLDLARSHVRLDGPFLQDFFARLCDLAQGDPSREDDLTALWLMRRRDA